MNDRFLPLTRRGLRCFRSGIGLAALCMLTGGIQQYVTLLSPGAGLSLRWLQPVVASMSVVASGLMLVGVLFMTACPAEAGVARWGIGILSLSALASLWPVVVYAADLPFRALSGPIGNAGIGLTAIQTVLLAGMLGALCRWMASVDRRAAACSGSALHSPEGAIETDPGAVWDTLAGRCQRLVHGATTFLVALVIVALLASPFNPVPSLQPMRQPLLAILGGFAVLIWGIALLLRVVGAVWGVDRAVRRSARLAADEERDRGGLTAERFGAVGIVAGALALGSLVANHWAEQALAPGWVDRHMKELVGNLPLELVGGSSYEVFRRAFDAAKAPLPALADPAAGALP